MASGTQHATEQLDQVIVRFAGDSGDGMQLTGDRFTTSSALLGNDLSTFPDFPAEIRAPAGTLNGVSAFQVHISDHDILTPGDSPNVLVAMNPAALKANIDLMAQGTVLIVNSDSFEERGLAKAGYESNPLTDGSLSAYIVYEVPMTSITQEVCKEAGVKPRDAERSKNFFALGLVSWLYTRPVDPIIKWITERFAAKPQVVEANTRAFRAGYDFGETAELFESNYEIRPATFETGEYVQVTGNQALAWGLITASRLAGLPLFLGSYPITPASDILHELSRRKEFGIRTFQAEDEIAGIGAALGASFGGAIGVTTTSGPGLDLKSETIGLAINLELPLVIVDVQRGGPSTGLPTKTEQADLLHAMYGRHGEAPLPILAPKTPSDCFAAAIEATRLAVTYRTPVILLSDGYLANGAEPWRLPDLDTFEPIEAGFAAEPNHLDDDGNPSVLALRPRSARRWPARGRRRACRAWSTASAASRRRTAAATCPTRVSTTSAWSTCARTRSPASPPTIPPVEVNDETGDAQLLLVSWGSTYAAVAAGVKRVRARGMKAAHLHLRHLNPLPSNLGEVLGRYTQILVPEMNLGQLSRILRAEYLVDAQTMSKMQGVPFRVGEIEAAITALLGGKS